MALICQGGSHAEVRGVVPFQVKLDVGEQPEGLARGAKAVGVPPPGILEVGQDGGELLVDLCCGRPGGLAELQGALLRGRHTVALLRTVKGFKV